MPGPAEHRSQVFTDTLQLSRIAVPTCPAYRVTGLRTVLDI